MIRSLFAVIAAVIAGFALAKMVESAGASATGLAPGSAGYGAILLLGWFLGAFLAALVAVLFGRKWAPLGALSAAAIFLGAVITLFSYPLSWLLWPGTAVATALGGYGAVKLTGAKAQHPAMRRKDGLFDG
ncbi:hypothetical protein [Hyphococcus luteus]|uniref:Uncharacterized protein n=1 Tax=Hyphococcus luteus TaxID=2058213 RepID=A0A2S7K2M8_9PROT|nr:hypothetical protein [Marinicaulis flavus]PQA86741.1 hypothetical protein CW354_14725 [Marinicaulis flavus]